MNEHLLEQIKKYFGGLNNVPEAAKEFIAAVEMAYTAHDRTVRTLTEEAAASARAMQEACAQVLQLKAKDQTTIDKLRLVINTLDDRNERGAVAPDSTDYDLLIDRILDIIEARHQAEREAEEHENVLRNVIENIPHYIFWKDKQSVYMGCNKNFAHIAGVEKPEQIFGKTDYELPWKKEEADIFVQLDNHIFAGGMPVLNMEVRQRQANGTDAVLLASKVPMYDAAGNVVGLVGIASDITELKKKEEELIELNKRLEEDRNLFLQGNVVLFRWRNEPGWPVEYVSHNARNVFGYSDTEFMSGKVRYEEVIHKDDFIRVRDEVLTAIEMNEKIFKHTEYRLVHKNGRFIWLLDYTTLIRNETGQVTHFFGYVIDITPLKEASAQADREKRRAEKLYQVVPSAIFSVDIHKRITSWNKKAAEITGYREDEVIGKDCSLFSVDPCLSQCMLYAQGAEKPIEGRECVIRAKSGRLLAISKNVDYVRDEEGKIVGGIESFEDITERKRVERQLQEYREHLEELVERRTRELERSNKQLTEEIEVRKKTETELIAAKEQAELATKAKSQFLANVSHEIRTPLNTIIGFSEMIGETQDLGAAKDRAGTVLHEAEVLLFLINDILDHSKIEAGKLTLESIPLQMRNFIDNIMVVNRQKAIAKGLRLELSFDEALPDWICTDPLRLRQVLTNLLDNAIKFTGKGSVQLCLSQEQASDKTVTIRFEVHDTGIGIPAEKQQCIFQNFMQVDGSTTRRYGGTGLGTSIAQRLVQLMGGVITFTSVEHEGSHFRFTLTFPKADERQLASLQKEMPIDILTEAITKKRNERDIRVLLVEDYKPNQEVILYYAGALELAIDSAMNGEEACRCAAEKQYDLIFMDIQMPVMDGYDAARTIRAEKGPNGNTPIIAMTANADEMSRRECLKAGMNYIITKPVRKNNFYRVLYEYLCGTPPVMTSEAAAAAAPADTAQEETAFFDYAAALSEFDGDEGLLATVMTGFTRNVEAQLPRMAEALETGDKETIRKEAHKIRGGAANLTANEIAGYAAQLETLAGDGTSDVASLRGPYGQLQKAYNRLKEYLQHKGGTK